MNFNPGWGKNNGFYVNIESTEFYRLFPYIVQEGWTKFIKDEEQAEKIFVSVIQQPAC